MRSRWSNRTTLYSTFWAAYDGCQECVAEALASGAVLVNQQSDRWRYTLMDWAVWGHQRGGRDTRSVQDLLVDHGAMRPSCGRLHTSAWNKPRRRPDLYKALSAAYDGCAGCVQQLLQSGTVRVDDVSDTCYYTLMDWALWGEQHGGNNTSSVQQLLVRPVEMLQLCGQLHNKACRDNRNTSRYRYFSAAFAGCTQCVRWYICAGVHPAVVSENQVYNALDWAIFGMTEHQDTDWVRGFLEARQVQPLYYKSRSSRSCG
jgi:hypothetical protein